MNNIGNLGASQASPATQGLAGQTATQGDNNSFFSALLMQQMGGADLSNVSDDGATPDAGQALAGGADLMKSLSALMGQLKDAKSSMPPNRQTDNTDDASNNPAIAMWLASMAAMQVQPNLPTPTQQPDNFSAQLTVTGNGQNAALQALEQQFPGLAQALKDKHLTDAKLPIGKADAQPASADVKNVDVKDSDPKNSSAVPAPEPKQAEVSQAAPVQANTDTAPAAAIKAMASATAPASAPVKATTAPDKANVDHKSPVANAVAKNNQPQLAPVTPQNQNTDAKSQSQSQPQSQSQSGDSHSGNQTKKDSAATAQTQQTGQANASANTATTAADQSAFAAMTQAATHNTPANTANHQGSAAADQTGNVRDIGSIVATDPTPRIVHTGKLMEAAGQAEMKVSVKSDAGTVDVRAMLEGDRISATVAAQHSGTRDWMMSNMHELQSSLSRDDLNLKTFEVTDTGLQNNGQDGQPRQQEQQQQRNSPAYASFFETETQSSTTSFDDIDSQETASQRALSLLA